MAKGFRPVDRDQAFLLPPSMRDWLPGDHLVWFVLDMVAALDTSVVATRPPRRGQRRSARGSVAGRAGYHPDLLLGLLIYAYAHGVVSSRRIERLCQTDVAFRILCANDIPDHTVIARFRQAHSEAFTTLFTQVLWLCGKAGLGQVGTVAVDGSKFAGSASADVNRDRDWFAEAARVAAERTAAAAATDAAEDDLFGPARGDEVPGPWADSRGRAARIAQCLAQLDAEAVAAAEAARAAAAAEQARTAARVEAAESALAAAQRAQQGKIDDYQTRWETAIATGAPLPPNRAPAPVEAAHPVRRAAQRLTQAQARHTQAQAQAPAPRAGKPPVRNLTDPDSRVMKTRRGWIQGYNAQFAITADQLVLATAVTQNPSDTACFAPMSAAAVTAATTIHRARHPHQPVPAHGGIGTLLLDAGYASDDNLTAPGPDRLIALGKARHHATEAKTNPAHGPPPENLTPRQAMDHRLRTPEGHALYRRRAATVEPGIGNIKKLVNRICRRGLTAATAEITFAATVHNLLKLHRNGTPIPTP